MTHYNFYCRLSYYIRRKKTQAASFSFKSLPWSAWRQMEWRNREICEKVSWLQSQFFATLWVSKLLRTKTFPSSYYITYMLHRFIKISKGLVKLFFVNEWKQNKIWKSSVSWHNFFYLETYLRVKLMNYMLEMELNRLM